MPSGYNDYEPVVNAEPAPPPPPRFTRSGLDATGQKIFDQLKQQRELIEKNIGADEAKKYYTGISGLTPNETLAMMAAELRDTGITDIYKVKQETQRIPVQMVTGESSEGGANYTTSFIDPSGQEVRDSSKVKRDAQGNFYEERPQFLNTETGQPLVTSVGRGEFQNDPNILTDMGVGKRMYSGTGVRFDDQGNPLYYSTGFKRDSNATSFLKGAAPVLGMAAGLLAGPAGLKLGALTSGAIGGGISGLAGSGGDLEEALKGAALGAAMGYGREALLGAAPSGLDAGMGTYDVSGFNPPSGIDASMGTYDAAGFSPDYSPDMLDELFGASDAALNLGSGANSLYQDGMVTPLSGDVPAPSTPNWDTGYPTQPEVPLGSLEPTASGPNYVDDLYSGSGAPDPSIPKAPLTPAGVASAALHDAVSDPYMIHELAGLDAMATPPTFLDKVAAGLAAAGSTAVDKLLTPAGALSAATAVASMADLKNKNESGGGGGGSTGWSGIIPRYTAEREVIKDAFKRDPYAKTQTGIDATGKPIYTPTPVMGRAFFKPLQYTPRPAPATPATNVNTQTPAEAPENMSVVTTAAQGGIMALNEGRYLRGPSDGMSDELMTSIDGMQPAALSHGEFVIPADVVSHLGNGNSDAGAKVLHKMMDRVRHARTGTMRQGKQINPDKFMPGGIVQLAVGGSAGTTATSGGVTGASPVTTSSNLSGWAAPVVSENIGRMEALAQEEYTPYEGQLTATASPTQTKAFEAVQKLSDPSRKWSASTMTTYMNPYLEGIQAPQIKEYERQADIRQQGIQSQFARAGAFGGSRELLARMENERILEDQREKLLGRTAFEAYDKAADMYGRERDRDVADIVAMLRAGGDERAIEAEGIAALRSEFDKQQNEPMRRLREFSNVLAELPIEATTKKADLSLLDQLGLSAERALGLYKELQEFFPDDAKVTK